MGANKLASDITNYNYVATAALGWMCGDHWYSWMKLGMKYHVPNLDLTATEVKDANILAQGTRTEGGDLGVVVLCGPWK